MAKSGPRHFFKVFFPEQSSTTLRIPLAFRERIEAESGKRVSLKGPSGSIWKVNLVKNSNEFFFYDGWKEFVADHSLVMGDFLVFRYRGNSRFKVLVFDSTACEKKKAFLARPSVEQSEESKDETSVVAEDEDEENKPLVLFAKKIFEKNLKRKRGINDISGISDILNKKKKQFQSEIDGLDSKRSKTSSSSKQVSIFRVGSLISQRRPVTEEEVKMTLERAVTFKSERPFAIAVMQDSYVYTSFFMHMGRNETGDSKLLGFLGPHL